MINKYAAWVVALAAAGAVWTGTGTAAAAASPADAPAGPVAAAGTTRTVLPEVGDWLRDIRPDDPTCATTTAWGDAYCPGKPLA
ncbi:hypothetical protein [Streptomyces sp. NRRL F-2580]|uniref:hypothetical protein n=1 Tax=Streptomyces sp. NRRL F-2580 TaxID=1463841 RepID=UPI0004C76825|nr:hypothetical protein [Streptomyces sp. NRRL F-2580]